MDNINVLAEQLLLGGSQEAQQISRDRRIAELLMAQGTQQPQGQMISGRYVAPAFTQQIAPLINAAMGIGLDKKIDSKQARMAEMLRQAKGEALNQFRMLASNPDTQAEAFQFANTNRFLQDIASELNKPRTQKEGEDFIIPGAGGKAIVISKGGDIETNEIRNKRAALGLPRDRGLWTEAQNKAFASYIEPDKAFDQQIKLATLRQANARLADDGIGGVDLPVMGGGMPSIGGQFSPAQISGALRSNPQGGMPMNTPMPGGAPMQGGTQPQSATYQPSFRLSPKQARENAGAVELQNQEAFMNKQRAADGTKDLIVQAAALLPKSTSGGLADDYRKAKAYVGLPTDGSGPDAQLGVVGAKLVANVPRFKGADSDKDVAQYMAAAGDVANPRKPFEDRMGALKTIYELNKKYASDGYADLDPKSLFASIAPKQEKPKAGRSSSVSVSGAPAMNAEDQAALKFLKENPNHPRAAEVRQRLGL